MRFTTVHKVTLIVTLCAVFSLSCMQPTDAEPVVSQQPAPEAPAPEEPAEEPQAFQPAIGTIYILDADDGIYLQDTVTDPDLFRAKCSAWEGAVESYNTKRTKPGPYPYRFVAGEAP